MTHRNATERHTEVMASFLKVGGTVEDNEDGSTPGKGVMDKVHKEDADEPKDEGDVQFSPVVRRSFIESRRRTLDEMFGDRDKAARQAKSDVRKVLKSDYESRSPLLEKTAADATLSDQVKNLGVE